MYLTDNRATIEKWTLLWNKVFQIVEIICILNWLYNQATTKLALHSNETS